MSIESVVAVIKDIAAEDIVATIRQAAEEDAGSEFRDVCAAVFEKKLKVWFRGSRAAVRLNDEEVIRYDSGTKEHKKLEHMSDYPLLHSHWQMIKLGPYEEFTMREIEDLYDEMDRIEEAERAERNRK